MQIRPKLLTHASILVMLGVLGSLCAPGDAQAVPLPPFDACGPQNGSQTSQVLGVNAPDGGLFAYQFKVCNTSAFYGELIRDWEIPWSDGNGINLLSITSPEGWSYSIETIGVSNDSTGWGGVAEWQTPGDPMQVAFPDFGTHTKVLHWYTGSCFEGCGTTGFEIFAGNELEEFGFQSPVGPVAGPYQASWMDLPPRTGDPPIPGGQIGAGAGVGAAAIPEPGSLALLALGIGALMSARVRRRRDDKA